MRCRICDREFDEIPKDAIEIRRRYGAVMYRFLDRQIHEFKIIPAFSKEKESK
jgi:hypothetical protein